MNEPLPSGDTGHPQAPKPKLITFHRMIPTARMPQRADRSAAGSLPTRAFRYCEAATSAAAFGYYVFPPIGFSVQWDGHDIMWTFEGAGEWLPLRGAAQFPGYRDYFDSIAPDEIKEFSPPFIIALQEPGLLQLWMGLVVRTAPGWSVLVRAPANLPRSGGWEPYEGIIETDRWFGPLFTNLRLTRTHAPIKLSSQVPLVQAQPLPRGVYTDVTLDRVANLPGMGAFSATDWDDYRRSIVEPNSRPDRALGSYAVEGRRRRRCPVPHPG